jgi:cobalt-precorrin 5A hydrolase/precorrin-3B C17-methyltransferase
MDTEARTAIFYITNNGLNVAQSLKALLKNSHIYKLDSRIISTQWKECESLIFIMATGIVVRKIARLIQDKKTDPAVVVLDEKGKFAISLLSGHLGGANSLAGKIADFLGGEAVITTGSDVNKLKPVDVWAEENGLVIENWKVLPKIGTKLINEGRLKIYSEIDIGTPEEYIEIDAPEHADLIITNRKDFTNGSDDYVCIRPRNLILGIGCNSGTDADEIESVVSEVLDDSNLSFLSVSSIATIDRKAEEPGLIAFAEKHNLNIETFTPDELNSVEGIEGSEIVFKYTGAKAVSEPAAMLASGADELLVAKQKSGNVTVAIAQIGIQYKRGKLYVVGVGSGNTEYIAPKALAAIRESEIIIGYRTYLDLISDLIEGKKVLSSGMTQEIDRCKKALELASQGKTVAVISSGDPGIYAMAGPILEVLKESNPFQKPKIEIIPGISALNLCAARLGAPVMHDFASISLSDRLTPWELIEERLEAAAKADFVIVLYNPKSKGRQDHICRARDIIMKHRDTDTPVGIVKGAMRDGEIAVVTNLEDMLKHDIDMQTTVIIGNSQTFSFDGYMITPRGYRM